MSYTYDSDTGMMTRKRKSAGRGGKRAFQILSNPQFSANWLTATTGPNSELQGNLQRLIEMSRTLEQDAYGSSFFQTWVTGVVGSCGYTLESCPIDQSGAVDATAARTIEDAWNEWKRAQNCTPGGDMPWSMVKRTTEQTFVRDGGVLIKCIEGFPGNEFGFAVQVLEVDQIDILFDRGASNGQNKVVMGKEIDQWGRVVAYHLYGEHPGEVYTRDGYKRTRVLAEGFIHRYHRTRAGRVQGVPMTLAAMTQLRHLSKYAEAEVIAARMHACASMRLQSDPSAPAAPFDPDNDDPDDNIFFDYELTPGGIADVPDGKVLDLLQSHHPHSSYGEFQKAVLRGAAAGLSINYNALASDLEGVNYSSLREGKLAQNAVFKAFQHLNIEVEEDAIFRRWLRVQLAMGKIGLPLAKFDKFKRAKWHAERKPWVDPLKEANATKSLLEQGLTSPRRVAAEIHNAPLEDILKERADDLQLMESLGLAAPEWANANGGGGGDLSATNPMDDSEDESDDEASEDEPNENNDDE